MARRVVLVAPEDDGVETLRAWVPPPWEIRAQEGADLGERLSNGLRLLSQDGNAVVLIASDAPAAPVHALSSALPFLEAPGRVLLGPCDDGGYYLIGLSSNVPAVFEGISWSTPVVLAQTRERCRQLSLECEELPWGYDVDNARDLIRFSADLSLSPTLAPRCHAFLLRGVP
jgi:uncharacterized protein